MRLWVSKLDRETQWTSEGNATGPPGKLVELVKPGVAGDTALSGREGVTHSCPLDKTNHL